MDAKGQGRGAYFQNFYARRALRILPLYYGVVVALTIVWPLVHAPTTALALMRHNQWWYWLHGTNVLWALTAGTGLPYNTGHFWSLAVEEQFYFVWPWVVWFADDRRLLRICIGCIVAAVLCRFALIGYDDGWNYALPVTRMDTLAWGAALALLARAPGGLARYRRLALGLAPAAAIVWATLYVASGIRPAVDPVFRTVGYSAAAVMYAAVIVLCLTTSLGRPLSAPLLRFFGKYSYGMYVFHWPLMLFMAPIYAVAAGMPALFGSRLPSQLTFLVLATALTSAVAVVSWQVFERHFLALKRFFPQAHASLDTEVPVLVAVPTRVTP